MQGIDDGPAKSDPPLGHGTGKLGIDATIPMSGMPGEGFKRPRPPLIQMDEAVRKKINSLFGNAGDKP